MSSRLNSPQNTIHGSQLPSERTFGLVFTLIFFLLAAYNWVSDGFSLLAGIFFALTVLFLIGSFVMPKILRPLNRAWYQLGLLMGKVVSPIVLGVLFFLVITPVALVMRLVGRDALKIRKQSVNTYWVDRAPPGPDPESFKEQF